MFVPTVEVECPKTNSNLKSIFEIDSNQTEGFIPSWKWKYEISDQPLEHGDGDALNPTMTRWTDRNTFNDGFQSNRERAMVSIACIVHYTQFFWYDYNQYFFVALQIT